MVNSWFIKCFKVIAMLLALCTIVMGQENNNVKISGGSIDTYKEFASLHVDSRRIDVWLPEDYKKNTSAHFAVLYMHDGQNLFDPALSYGGNEWGIDEAVTELMNQGTIKKTIVVGIWNSPKRMREYQVQEAFQFLDTGSQRNLSAEYNGGPISDHYLEFIVKELKPFIDSLYRTKPDQKNTFMMGSSMGGLISIYAISRYPNVFGGVACLSTHWPVSLRENNSTIAKNNILYLQRKLPVPSSHKIYFDYGTKTLDAWYEKSQSLMDGVMTKKGYKRNKNWITKKFEGADHSEKSWRNRVKIPLTFLLKK